MQDKSQEKSQADKFREAAAAAEMIDDEKLLDENLKKIAKAKPKKDAS